jgi:drug/metabolite transporter superfamily protein YnfA
VTVSRSPVLFALATLFEIGGAAICLAGVAVIMYARRAGT